MIFTPLLTTPRAACYENIDGREAGIAGGQMILAALHAIVRQTSALASGPLASLRLGFSRLDGGHWQLPHNAKTAR